MIAIYEGHNRWESEELRVLRNKLGRQREAIVIALDALKFYAQGPEAEIARQTLEAIERLKR
jgi:hypothetical protein